eukprot:3006534-Amphidinium_carterae.1
MSEAWNPWCRGCTNATGRVGAWLRAELFEAQAWLSDHILKPLASQITCEFHPIARQTALEPT